MKTYTCTECGTSGHLCLLEGGKCADCARKPKPKPKPAKRKRGNQPGRRWAAHQLPETVELQQQCAALMNRLDLRPYRFALLIGLTHSAFARWYGDRFTVRGQPGFNAKVRRALAGLEENA